MYRTYMLFLVFFFSPLLLAQADVFKAGTAIQSYGKIAEVPGMKTIPADAKFKVSFDVDKPAEKGEVNRSLDSVARFINMHVAAGVDVKNIQLAVVVHGGAVKEMTNDTFYQQRLNSNNANIELIEQLQKLGVQFFVCGQSAAYHKVVTKDLLPGINMSLSAMTAHALLQQQGYTLNPF